MSIVRKKNNFFLFWILLAGVLLLGCSSSTSPPASVPGEQLGGKYNATIQTVQGGSGVSQYSWKEITYTKDGARISGEFSDNLVGGLDYIKENTPEDSTFVAWWDYGPSIVGYTGRGAVVETPSKEIADTVSTYRFLKTEDERKQFLEGCTTPHTRIVDVARVLTADDTGEAIRIMKTYGASYLFISESDRNKLWVFYRALGKEPISQDSPEFDGTILGRAFKGESIGSLEMVYSDGYVKIYHLE